MNVKDINEKAILEMLKSAKEWIQNNTGKLRVVIDDYMLFTGLISGLI